eukprot:10200127-Heterocapsa_arctica.AAC.1
MFKHRNADNAFQDGAKHKHVDISMDGDRKDGDECYYALGDSKHLGAKLFNRLYWSQNESKHSTNIGNHLYEVAKKSC